MALATLSIDLVAKLASFEEGFNKAARLAAAQSAQIEASISKIGSVASAAFGALGVAAAGTGLAVLAKTSIDAIDALNDVADATGSSVENISALEDVALRTGTSLATVETALIKFNAVLKEAKPGSDAELALKAIGLSAQELRRLDPAEALKKTADALAGFADDGNKARLTQELFGKSLKEVAPFLKDLSEAQKLNATVTAEQAAEAEKFNKALAGFSANAEGFRRGLLGTILPAVNEAVDRFKAAQEAFGGTVGALLRNDFTRGDFRNAVEGLQFYQEELRKLTATRAELLVEAAGGGESGLQAQAEADAAERRIETVRKQITFYELLTKTAKDAAGAGRGVVVPGQPGGKASVGELPTKPEAAKPSDFDKLAEKLQQRIALQQADAQSLLPLTEAQKAALDVMEQLRAGTIKLSQAQATKVGGQLEELMSLEKLNEARKAEAKWLEESGAANAAALEDAFKRADAIEAQIQATERAIEETGLEGAALDALKNKRLADAAAMLRSKAAALDNLDSHAAMVEQWMREAAALDGLVAANDRATEATKKANDAATARGIISETQQGKLDALTAQYSALASTFEAGGISAKQYADGLDVLDEKFSALTKLPDQAAKEIDRFAEQAQRDLQSGFAGTFESLFRGEFDNIGQMWSDLLIKMAAQAVSQNLMAAIFGTAGTGGPAGGGWLLNLFGQADGGAWSKGLQFYATGDVFGAPTLFERAGGGLGVIGEAGPEAVMPLKRGPDGKLGVAASGGASAAQPVQLTINQTVGNLVTQQDLARVAEQTYRAALAGVADAQMRGRM